MEKTLKILIVSPGKDQAQLLTDAYNEHFMIGESHSTRTLHKAIQSHLEEDYDVCMIWEDYNTEELQSFFKDYEKLGKRKFCLFLQVKKTIPEEFDQSKLKETGFLGAVSPHANFADREYFETILQDNSYDKEIYRRKIDVTDALAVALREIDRVARDTKRGRATKFNTLSLDFISMQTEFDQQILDKYFQELSHKTEEAAPEEVFQVQIPDKVLKRQLPNLSENNYTGASDRVWKKLKKRYGVDS